MCLHFPDNVLPKSFSARFYEEICLRDQNISAKAQVQALLCSRSQPAKNAHSLDQRNW